jgi:hypothetical protein
MFEERLKRKSRRDSLKKNSALLKATNQGEIGN